MMRVITTCLSLSRRYGWKRHGRLWTRLLAQVCDTFIYGVSRADGLFYPSKVGMQFGEDILPFDSAPYWRVWENMQSLIDRGIDPLTLLIDRAHEKGMDFFASLRMGGYGGMDPNHTLANGGTRIRPSRSPRPSVCRARRTRHAVSCRRVWSWISLRLRAAVPSGLNRKTHRSILR